MSDTAYDILFAPIFLAEWRQRCRDIIKFLKDKNGVHIGGKAYPPGGLTLEKFVEAFHKGHTHYWEAGSPRVGNKFMMNRNFEFTGDFGIDDEGFAYYYTLTDEGKKIWRSIQDSNLHPNDYNDHFVFLTEEEAVNYINAPVP